MTRVIKKQITLNAPIEQAWFLWTQSDQVEKWFAPKAVIEPVLGGRYELYFVPGNMANKNTVGCQVLTISPNQSLTVSWKGPSQFSVLMNDPFPTTTLTIRFKKLSDTTTCVKLYHEGFGADVVWDAAYDWHDLVWAGVLKQLQDALDQPECLLGFTHFPDYKQTASCVG